VRRGSNPLALGACLWFVVAVGCSTSEPTVDADSGVDADLRVVPCTFHVTSAVSPVIPTVGIVTWSTSLPRVTEANIDFGLTTSYGMTAPVDLEARDHRTLLLGMKASRTYHFRVDTSGGGDRCVSPDYTIETGKLPSGLPQITVTTRDAAAVFGGFLLTGQYVQMRGGPAYILDADGDIVWWYSMSTDATGVVMSYDGRFMWINAVNVPDIGANVHRVSMDGLTDLDLSSSFTGQNHQLTVLPDETVAFYAYNRSTDCDEIEEYSPSSGKVRRVVNSEAANHETGMCHLNCIRYSRDDDTLVFSDDEHDDLTKISRTGTTVWILNGTTSSFAGSVWSGGEHGVDILGLNDLLLFNNNSSTGLTGSLGGGTGTGSIAMEIRLDPSAMTAARTWSYKASPAIQNDVLGDVQRLPNGNTVVAYSTRGVLEEVDAKANLVQRWTWPAGTYFGYIQKRATLYGPPPR
jgi:Arylsulfotransferase (ASST)